MLVGLLEEILGVPGKFMDWSEERKFMDLSEDILRVPEKLTDLSEQILGLVGGGGEGQDFWLFASCAPIRTREPEGHKKNNLGQGTKRACEGSGSNPKRAPSKEKGSCRNAPRSL